VVPTVKFHPLLLEMFHGGVPLKSKSMTFLMMNSGAVCDVSIIVMLLFSVSGLSFVE
jgi:hypothetical protein